MKREHNLASAAFGLLVVLPILAVASMNLMIMAIRSAKALRDEFQCGVPTVAEKTESVVKK